MDEEKAKELDAVNVLESRVTVETVVRTTETVIKRVEESREVVGEPEKVLLEGDCEDCEVGDVMVEVLGSEVIVDGIGGASGEMGSGELGHERGDLGAVTDGGGFHGGSGVDESVSCEGRVSAEPENDSALNGEGNVARQLRDDCLGSNDSYLANNECRDDESEACDIEKEKTVEEAVVEGDVERELGDASRLEKAVLLDNGAELCGNSNSLDIEGKADDAETSVLHCMSSITSNDQKMGINEEEGLGTIKGEDKAVSREEDGLKGGDEQVVLEAGVHGCGTLLADESVNGGVNSLEASISGQEKPVAAVSVSRNSENVQYEASDLHTQVNRIELMDGANVNITVQEPDMPINCKMINERLQFDNNDKSEDAVLTASLGHENGAVSEVKVDGTDMEIDATGRSLINSDNQLVDMNKRGEDIKNNVILTSPSKVPEKETPTVGMDIDAVDATFVNKGIVCEAPRDDLKSSSENQKPAASTLAKRETETVIVDDNTKLSDPIASSTMEKQCMGVEDKVQGNVENLSTSSLILDAEVCHNSVVGNLTADLLADSSQERKCPAEGYLGHPPGPDDSSDVKGVIQEQECGSDASHIECLDDHTADGNFEIGLNLDDFHEVQEVIHSKQVSVDHALPVEDDNSKSLMDTVGVALGGSNEAVLEVPDEHDALLNVSTHEDKNNKLSMEDVVEGGSNMEVAQEVEEVLTENNLNMEREKEVQKKAVNAEGFIYINNATPDEVAQEVQVVNNSNMVDMKEVQDEAASDEEETPKQAIEMSQAENCIMDETIVVGPFIVETEDAGDCFPGNGCVDMDSGPIHEEDGKSGAHVAKGIGEEVANHDAKSDSDMEDAQDNDEDTDSAEQVEEQEFDDEQVSASPKAGNKEEKNFSGYAKAENLLEDHRVSYRVPFETQGEFSVADLVWGKVKSHPWWPGQIFHPSDSSEKAMKYFRKDCYLVAYFGDRTFAWNEASVLRPFSDHFAVAERQNKTDAFQNAVNCALAEVSRRMELGLACCCVSQEDYDKIRYQIVENAGIREESSKRDEVDSCSGLDYLHPDKLVQYVRSLAISPTSSVDRLELVIAKAQLVAFLRLKGIDSLANFQYYEGISGPEDSSNRFDSNATSKGPKRKHNLKDIVYQRRKEKSMNELMGETMYYLDSEFDSHEEDDNMLTSPTGIKRKASGFSDFTSQHTTRSISVAKVSHTPSSNSQQSFKVGERIRRVASQLTRLPSTLKGSSETSDGGSSEHLGDGVDEVLEPSNHSPAEMSPSPSRESSPDEFLSQLQLCAQDPMKGYSFLANMVGFFLEFRNLAVSTERQRMRKMASRKRKSSAPIVGKGESFEFDDRNDSYWKDMVVQNSAEAKPARRSRKRKDEQGQAVHSEKPSQSKPRKSSRKQYFHGALGSTVESSPLGEEKGQNQSPAELMLNFTGMGSLPSEMNLNKMFKSFGALKESETEIDAQSGRARVVFKKRSDAEVAYSSAAMFNIFGSTLVNYQLNYTPSVSFKTSPLPLTDSQEKAT